MLGLDTTHRQFAITSGGKYQDQFALIWSTWTNNSEIHDVMIRTKTTKESASNQTEEFKLTKKNAFGIFLSFDFLIIQRLKI